MTFETALLLIALAVGILALGTWLWRNPACPTCSSRSWNRKLCYPLLLCRRCSQRIDRSGRKHN